MRKFLPLILAILIGLSGYLYFNQKVLSASGIEQVYIYNNDDYKSKNPSPFMKLEQQSLIDTVVKTINSSESVNRELSTTPPNYVFDIIYSKNKKETFYLWINEDTSSAMYKNKDDSTVHIVSKEDTNRLNTLVIR